MAESKKEFSASDAEPVVLYGLTDTISPIAIPIICNSDGSLQTTV